MPRLLLSHERSARAMSRLDFRQAYVSEIQTPCRLRSGPFEKWELVDYDEVDDPPKVAMTRAQMEQTAESQLPKAFVVKNGRTPKWVCREVGL